jgi:hypothetical protein
MCNEGLQRLIIFPQRGRDAHWTAGETPALRILGWACEAEERAAGSAVELKEKAFELRSKDSRGRLSLH